MSGSGTSSTSDSDDADSSLKVQSSSPCCGQPDLRKLFCLKCNKIVCALCYIREHSQHGYVQFEQIRSKFEDELERLTTGIRECDEMTHNVDRFLEEFEAQTVVVENEVKDKARDMKEQIDKHEQALLTSVVESKNNQRRLADQLKEKTNERKRQLTDLKTNLDVILARTPVDEIALQMNDLQNKCEQLMNLDILKSSSNDLAANKVTFCPVNSSENYLGKITATVQKSNETDRLKHVFDMGRQVGGVTSLGDKIYIVRYRNKQKIHVFNADTFEAEKPLVVPGLSDLPWCLTSCPINNCLYTCDDCNAVHRVDLLAQRKSHSKTRWSVASTPTGLSVNRDGNVIVACYGADRLQVYSSAGNLKHEVILSKEMSNPLHAVQLDNGMFLVCYGEWEKKYRVGVAGPNGKCLAQYYNTNNGTQRVQFLSGSSGASVISGGSTIVCEWSGSNHRVLMLNKSLSGARDLLIGSLKQPWSVWVDKSRGRLYIGEQKGGRVLVYDNVFTDRYSTLDSSSADGI